MGYVVNKRRFKQSQPHTVTITITSYINHTGGALVQTDLSGPMTAVTLSPAQGFAIATPTITGSGITATASGNDFIISGTPRSDVTVSAAYTTLIPYSNQSKIITYLVPANFPDSSSTTWGDDYSAPMTRSRRGSWALTNENKSVVIENEGVITRDEDFTIYPPTNNMKNFTFYIVGKYETSTTFNSSISFGVRLTSHDYWSFLLKQRDDISPPGIGSWFTQGSGQYANGSFSDTTLYSSYHTYGFSRNTSNKTLKHALDDSSIQNLVYADRQITNAVYYFKFLQGTSASGLAYHDKVYIQLLAIVSEEDSPTNIINNISNIRSKLNLT